MPRRFFIGCVLIAMIMGGLLAGGALQPYDMPDDAKAGFVIWRENGCESCHTLFGQGGNYGPDLTHIYDQRGENYIREFMVNPNAFHPNQRMMPRFTISVGETSDLMAFLKWVGESEVAQNWPPNPIQVAGMGGLGSGSGQSVSRTGEAEEDPLITQGRQLFTQKCASCHSLQPDILIVGPSLYGIADTAWYRVPGTAPQEYIRQSILNPGAYVVAGYQNVMQPNLAEQLSGQDVDALVAFLMTMEGQ